MASDLKTYDGFQVLRSVFDPDKNCLRVCLVDGGAGGGPAVEVIIDHTTDSIRIGDGVNLITSTAIGAKQGLDVNVINSAIVSTPEITRISTLANNETSHTFDPDMKRFEVIVEGNSRLQYAFTMFESGTNYDVLYPGNRLIEDNIAKGSNLTLYFQTKLSSIVIIKEWK